jgi:hypothetical protein
MSWRTAAIGALLLFYAYWAITEWVDLFPWNDVSKSKRSDQVKGTVVYSSAVALLTLGIAAGYRWVAALAAGLMALLLIFELANWWLPYLFGVHAWEIDREVYARQFSRTLRFLPRIGDRNVPDAQHVVLNLVTLAAAVAAAMAYLR